MPDLVMHYYFANKLYKSLPKEVTQKIIDKNIYIFASAGPDPFFFYKFYNFKENKRVADIGHFMHKNKIYDFFHKLTTLTKESNEVKDLLFSYLTGYIAHHTLDSLVHPYVFHKTGKFNKKDVSSHEYRGLHMKLERAMDAYIIREYYRQKPHKFDIVCEVLNLKKLPISLEESFNELYSLFDVSNGFDLVNDTVYWQRRFYSFIKDSFGVKNFFLKLLDSKKMPVGLSYITYYKKEIDDIDILNINKNPWNNPSDESIVSTKSVLELMDEAIQKGKDIIEKLYQYIYLDNPIDLSIILPKTSYHDGLEQEYSNMKYFNNIFSEKKNE